MPNETNTDDLEMDDKFEHRIKSDVQNHSKIKDKKMNTPIGVNFFLSLFIFLISMMSVLFTRMELKRKSYEIYKLSSEYKIHDDEFRTLYTDYSKKVSDREISGLALNRYSIKGYRVGKVINIGSTSFMVKQ